jgi:hypothetical protein
MIYFKCTLPTSIIDLLEQLFSYVTTNGEQMRNIQTYIDKECTVWQCNSGKMRSYEDIAECVITYFPNATRKEIIHAILAANIVTDEVKLKPYFIQCSDIERINIVWYKKLNHE